LGDLPIDLESEFRARERTPNLRSGVLTQCLHVSHPAVDELRTTGRFQDMEKSEDEDEHSIEMHLPYIRKVFEK
jgi:hypothetical protein